MSINILFIVIVLLIIVGIVVYFNYKHNLTIKNHSPFGNVWLGKNKKSKSYAEIAKNLLRNTIRLLNKKNIDVIAMYGTLLGSMRHEGFIPWDDDIDVMINKSYFSVLLEMKDELGMYDIGIKEYSMFGTNMIKLFVLSEPLIPGHNWSWPFIDVFGYIVEDSYVYVDDIGKSRAYKFSVNDLFPLKTKLFEGIRINIPNNTKLFLDIMYKKDWNDVCISSSYNHRKENRISNVHNIKCSDLVKVEQDLFHYCWVINLERRPDRWKITEKRLNKIGIAPKRWNATDAKDIEFQSFYETICSPKRSIGEIACYISHHKLWKYIYDNGIPYALIFEDDAIFAPKITKKDIMDEIKHSDGFNIIYLGHCFSNMLNFTEPIVSTGKAQCLHAYVISREAIKKLLNTPIDFSLPIDKITEKLCSSNLCYISHNVPYKGYKTYGSGIILQDKELGSNLLNKGIV